MTAPAKTARSAPQRSGAEPAARTRDGRYIVVRGRLWRAANPHLAEEERQRLVGELMDARRAIAAARRAGDPAAERAGRARVQAAKVALGERGPVWWTDGAPDLNRHMARNTPYAAELDATPQPSIAKPGTGFRG